MNRKGFARYVKRRLIKKGSKLLRMEWYIDSTCPICQEDYQYIFTEPPDKADVLMCVGFPCSKCLNKFDKALHKPRSKKSLKINLSLVRKGEKK